MKTEGWKKWYYWWLVTFTTGVILAFGASPLVHNVSWPQQLLVNKPIIFVLFVFGVLLMFGSLFFFCKALWCTCHRTKS
mgnify:CR=1 FL=1